MSEDLILGRFQVLKRLGKGGSGIVELCRDTKLGRQVAVKRITIDRDDDTEMARVLREARNTAQHNHPGIVHMYEWEQEGDHAYLIMEYVDGPNLLELTKEHGHLPVERTARLLGQVAEALDVAHHSGTVHRDIKPGNILVGPHDRAKLTDFGLARAGQDDQLTSTGMFSGTAPYFSPELANGDVPGPESDVWALGVTLYYCLQGRLPVNTGDNPLDILAAIARGHVDKSVDDPSMQRVLDGMMAMDPRDRWTAGQAGRELTRIAEGMPSVSSQPPPPQRDISRHTSETEVGSPQHETTGWPTRRGYAAGSPSYGAPAYGASHLPQGNATAQWSVHHSGPVPRPGAAPTQSRQGNGGKGLAVALLFVILAALAVVGIGMTNGWFGSESGDDTAKAQTTSSPTPTESTSTAQTNAPFPDGVTQNCNRDVAVNTYLSCPFAENILANMRRAGADMPTEVDAYSPQTQKDYTVSCDTYDDNFVECTHKRGRAFFRVSALNG